MPGIIGVITRQPAAEIAPVARAMCAALRHEPFYLAGDFAAPEFGVYAGWTALPDSFAASQVFQNESGDVSLVFSGECFLDPAENLRLRQKGHAFSERGGAWLVHQYEEQGDAFFQNLNGIFSGLLIDRSRRRVILFNDRYGLDRVYWHQTPAAFYFASEAKALLRVLPALREFDRDGVAEFLGAGCPLGGKTLFRGVSLLPPASRWTFENAAPHRAGYFSPPTWEQLPPLSGPEYEARFRAVFQRILPRYFTADATLGLSLTGGLDTRALMAGYVHDPDREISYTFTGPEGETLDDRVARRVAAACRLPHRLLRLGPDFFTDFAAHADRTVFITDGCSGILGAHEIYFHRQARRLAPLRLTGNFGGEIFRSVSSFKSPCLAPEIFAPDLLPHIQAAVARLSALKKHPVSFAAFHEVPLNLFGNLAAGRSLTSFRTPYLDNELVALAYQCPPSLAKSPLPLIRYIKAANPALDRIPTDRGYISDRRDPEILLRRLFAEVTFKLDYCSDAGLPGRLAVFNPVFKPFARGLAVSGLHKYLKYGAWFRESLEPYVMDRMAAAQHSTHGFWDATNLATLVHCHLSGVGDFPAEVNAVLTLESVARQFFPASSFAPADRA